MKKEIFAAGAATLAALALTGCSNQQSATGTTAGTTTTTAYASPSPTDSTNMAASSAMAGGNIVEVAQGDPRFSTLVKAVQAAGLAETLATTENVTVFAPTNEAFAALGEDKLADLLKPENKAKLASILQYHVVPKRVASTDVAALQDGAKVDTLLGGGASLSVDKEGTEIEIGDADLVQTDIPASNGVIHAIDEVLMPPAGAMNGAPPGPATGSEY